MLADTPLPQAVQQEILDTIAQQCDRDKIDTPNSAALFDAILIVNLMQSDDPSRCSLLAWQAITAAGCQRGAAYLAQ